MDAHLRVSGRLGSSRLPARSIILPSPELDEGDENGASDAQLLRLPRGADPNDYDLAVEDDYEIWSRTQPHTIKGRRTAASELDAERAAFHLAAWDDGELSALSSTDDDSDASSEHDSGPLRDANRTKASRRPAKPQRQAPRWSDEPWPELPVRHDGEYGAPPPARALVADRKAFCVAGLYASQRSCTDPTTAPALPLPVHMGATMLATAGDFVLSFDIATDYHRLTGGGRARFAERLGYGMQPPRYTRIDRNHFVERHRLAAEHHAVCQCRPGDACDEACINRLMLYVCPTTCQAGETCTNQPLNHRRPVAVLPFWTGTRGWGLKTLADIPQGAFIMEYVGEVLSRDESWRRVNETYAGATAFYLLDYDGGEVLDAGLMGSPARFANHSCDPNVIVERWKLSDQDEYQIGLFAACDIVAGTELTYNYGWLAFSSLAPEQVSPRGSRAADGPGRAEPAQVRCLCGADACTGWLGAKRKKIESALPAMKRRRL